MYAHLVDFFAMVYKVYFTCGHMYENIPMYDEYIPSRQQHLSKDYISFRLFHKKYTASRLTSSFFCVLHTYVLCRFSLLVIHEEGIH